MVKLKVAIFSFTGCEGCQLEIMNSEIFFELFKRVDFLSFKTIKEEKMQHYDVSFVEGAISSKTEAKKLKKIRENSKILVALGSCACLGGISALKNYVSKEKAYPLKNYVKVDFWLRGCPIVKEEFEKVLKEILIGKILKEDAYPVCIECKKNELLCLLKKGKICLGPLTYGGCNAVCLSSNFPCLGCRGILEDANLRSEIELIEEFGIDRKDFERILKMFYEPQKD